MRERKTAFKRGAPTPPLTDLQKEQVIELFHTTRDNTSREIAEKLGVPVHRVSKCLNDWFEKKMKLL